MDVPSNGSFSFNVSFAGLAATVGAAVLLYAGSRYLANSRHGGKQPSTQEVAPARSLVEEDEQPDIPDEWTDPISRGLITEPVVLCATGQVYDYSTLREWLRTGNKLCPRTNLVVSDAQIARLPCLKATIQSWMKEHGMPLPPPDTTMDQLAAINPKLPGWINDIRTDTGTKRVNACAELYEVLRQWEANSYAGATYDHDMVNHKFVREAVMDDMIWLVRYGDAYLQGVAASVLAYADTTEEVQYLAAVCTPPAVMLCLSPSNYTSQAATRLLYNIARAGATARHAIVQAGGIQALLRIVATDREEYGYARDRAAATLAVLAKDIGVRFYLKRYAAEPLMRMLIESEDRWEKRDAATALLKLQLTQEELRPHFTIDQLCEYWWCSRAWLEGKVARPNQGYTPQELEARAALMRTSLTAHELMDRVMARDLDLAEWIFAGAQIAQAAAAEAQQAQQQQQAEQQAGQEEAEFHEAVEGEGDEEDDDEGEEDDEEDEDEDEEVEEDETEDYLGGSDDGLAMLGGGDSDEEELLMQELENEAAATRATIAAAGQQQPVVAAGVLHAPHLAGAGERWRERQEFQRAVDDLAERVNRQAMPTAAAPAAPHEEAAGQQQEGH